MCAEAAFAELERRAYSSAARLQVNLSWSEEQRRLLAEQVNRLRDMQARSLHLEKVNEQLRADNATVEALRERLAESVPHNEFQALQQTAFQLQQRLDEAE